MNVAIRFVRMASQATQKHKHAFQPPVACSVAQWIAKQPLDLLKTQFLRFVICEHDKVSL